MAKTSNGPLGSPREPRRRPWGDAGTLLDRRRVWDHRQQAKGLCRTCGIEKTGKDVAYWSCFPCRLRETESPVLRSPSDGASMRMSLRDQRAFAEALLKPPKPSIRLKTAAKRNDGPDSVTLLCRAHGLPEPEKEQRFIDGRKFRADNLWRRQMVILEIEGGLFSRSFRANLAHSSPTAILRDMEKGNLAQMAGYIYLRATPEQVQKGEILPMLKEALA